MATKKLSEPMKKALLSADADGWIPSGVIKVETFCALIDRRLTGIMVRRDDTMTLGHWLTDAGKAKVAELRRINDPVQAYTMAIAEYVVRDGNPDDVMPSAPEIRVGDLIEIRQPGKRKWAMRVERYSPSGWQGTQIRVTDGAPGRTRFTGDLKPGEYTIVERAKPTAEPCRGCGGRPMTSGGHNHRAGCETANPRAVAAEQPRKTVTANVKLTPAQVDAIHWIGAPDAVQMKHHAYRPHGRTIKALRARLLLASDVLALNEDGRAAFLEQLPTGRLPHAFTTAWSGTRALTPEPAPAVEPDGPACLADEPTYAHDAHCNTAHKAGPESCPPARGPVVVECTVEANPTTDTITIERADWDAMTPVQRLRTIEHHALESVNQAGGWGWGIEDEADAAEVASQWKPEAIEAIMHLVLEYGVARTDGASFGDRVAMLADIRKALWDLVTE